MTSLLVIPKNLKEFQLLKKLFCKMNVLSYKISLEQKEDLALTVMLKDVNRNNRVSRKTIMKKL